ncbi:TonB-dependent receptor [Rhodocytophaga aerolata]|uniref:TonB-dependent receptor n=1 Tax=Rhodocytophaga aerolata TaxID=455078 RepID=A0ABT8RCH1_9BACT|nr:TonB-dependent receptor [Rhodocytophaga aerolata]MDO1449760.1 TonB-dependent receptor [Rhodocytophaga aerolata]
MRILQKGLLLAFTLFFCLPLWAQSILDKKISLPGAEFNLERALEEIGKRAGIPIALSSSQLPAQAKVRFPSAEISVREALDISLQHTGLKYAYLNGQIIISKRAGKGKKATVSGYIRSAETNENLIGANIYSAHHQTGASSNAYGFYSFTLPADSLYLRYSYVGYQTHTVPLLLNGDTVINIYLSQLSLQEVEVLSSKMESPTQLSTTSRMEIPVERIEAMPAFFGEVDVLKSIQFLPGVQSGMEGSTALYVRGGGPDHNLILIDGVPVYNVSHLFGFFSVFNSDAINHVELYKGGFPARYGGRLSSVINVTTREGNNKSLKGEGSIGLISSKLTLEGPIKNEKTSFLVSARRTYLDALARPLISLATPHTMGYFFYDLNGKINHQFSHKDRLYLSAYLGNDKLRLKFNDVFAEGKRSSDDGLRWGNITSALRWNHIFSSKMFSNAILTYSSYDFSYFSILDQQILSGPYQSKTSSNDKYLSGIRDWSLRTEFEYFPSARHAIRFGGQATAHAFSPGASRHRQTSEQVTEIDTAFDGSTIHTSEFALYAEDDFSLTEQLKMNLGVHGSGYQTGPSFYTSLQPRLSLRYLLRPDFALKGSFVTMTQYIHLLTNSGIGLPTDLWVPATSRIKPQESRQWVAGLSKDIGPSLEVSLEGYYKSMNHVIEFAPATGFFEADTDWESNIISGKGESYGLEVLLQKKTGRLTGWAGYTLSKTDRQFASINKGKKFPYKYDRRHDVDLTLSYQLKPHIQISGNWVYGTGNAVSLPLQRYTSAFTLYNRYSREVYQYEGRNNFRMKPVHRMDLSISFSKQKKWGERKWIVSLYNAYSRMNPLYYTVSTDYSAGLAKKKFIQYSVFPIIPSLSYHFKF